MSRNQVVLVDTNDVVVGSEDKLLAHQQGQLHRAFSIFVARRRHGVVEVLLQQRAFSKYHCGGLWSNTCCSHPQPDEDLKTSALSRLYEELGFRLDDIEWVASHCYRAVLENGLIEHEFDHLFVGWDQNPQLNINSEEVHQTKWLSVAAIEYDVINNPASFTPWFAETFKKVRPRLLRCESTIARALK